MSIEITQIAQHARLVGEMSMERIRGCLELRKDEVLLYIMPLGYGAEGMQNGILLALSFLSLLRGRGLARLNGKM